MPDILTVTMNPAVDLATVTPVVRPVHKLRCAAPLRIAGGGGVNVARVLHRLGASVMALVASGGATGAHLQALLAADGVALRAIGVSGETRENLTVTDEASRQEYRFVMPGPRLRQDEWQACLDAVSVMSPAPGCVIASGSLPPGVPQDFYARLARWARSCGSRLVLDASGPSLAAALEEGVFLVKPSLRELRELTGRSLGLPSERIAAARELVAQGRAAQVALSLGEQGALLVTQEGVWTAKALPVMVAGTVGAGDSLLAAMVWALEAGMPPGEVLAAGVAAGSVATERGGSHLVGRDAVLALMPQVAVARA